MLFERLKEELEANRDSAQAASMKAALKGKLKFLGVLVRKRTNIFNPIFTLLKKRQDIDWDFVGRCWAEEYREFQNAGARYLLYCADKLSLEDIPRITELAQDKAWWDTVDIFAEIFGLLAIKLPELNDTMIGFSTNNSIWLRRIAILHQSGRGDKINFDLAEKIILPNLAEKEFYIEKAIALILREYSMYDSEKVKEFIAQNRENMTTLTIREAEIYMKENSLL